MSAPSDMEAQSQAAIEASITRLQVGWNAGSGMKWAAEFEPDATFVNILGAYVGGAAAIEALHDKILSGPFKGSTIALARRDVRFLSSGAAIVEVTASVVNFAFLPPGAVATAPNRLETLFLFIYQNRSGTWKIEAAQNTAVLPSASPMPSPSSSA